MPVREIGGDSQGNLAGVVHYERKQGTFYAALNANRKIPAASVRIFDRNASLLDERVDLEPERVWKKEIRVQDAGRKYRFELRSKEGSVLIAKSECESDWRPGSESKVGPR